MGGGGGVNCVESYLLDSHNKNPAININALFLRDFAHNFRLKIHIDHYIQLKKYSQTNVIY